MNWLQILNNTFAQILAPATLGYAPVSYTHLTLPTNREV